MKNMKQYFVETEYELLCEFFNQIRIHDPDLIIGYNYVLFWLLLYVFDAENLGCIYRINDEFDIYIPGCLAIDIYICKYAKSLNLPSSNLKLCFGKVVEKAKN
ncbi:hypothetical protein H8356DRAFT_1360537 [Neocallimastix lanati (nom. inval.)]|nr:hypothetical protein H8356DRAFT_1360537 [Neocallimastix sp. JGI-2020a]